MVLGMNTGRNGDHRRGNTQGRKERVKDNESAKQDPIPQIMSLPQPKHKPSAEQVHIARLLTDDRTPSDIQERVLQVQTVVDCPEENIIIALHDNEFDVEKACEALLDSNGSSKEEWTTMATSKKSKKKTESPAPSKKGSSTKGTSKAAAQHTRQTFGGSVSVTTTATLSGDDTEQERRGRGRSHQSGSRGRPGRRGERNMGPRKRSERDRKEGKVPPRTQPPEESWDKETREGPPPVTMTMNLETTEDSWDVDDTVQPRPSSQPSDDWVMVSPTTSYPELGKDNLQQTPSRPSVNTLLSLSPVSEVLQTVDDKLKPKPHHRRFKASQIPDQPVEMPSGIDTLTLDMSVLGINFGFETTPLSPPISDPSAPPSNEAPVSPSTVIPTSPHTSNPSFEQPSLLNQTTTTTPQLIPGSPYASIADDPVIISSYTEKPPGNLEPPPGLIHPSQQQQQQQPPPEKPPQATPTLIPPPEPISLPPLNTPPSTSTSQATSNLGLLSTSMTSGGLTHPTEVAASSSSYSIGGMGLHSTGSSSFPVSSSVTTPTSTQQLFPVHSVSTASPVVSMTTVPPVQLSSTMSSTNGVTSSSRTPSTSHPAPPVTSGTQVGKVHSASTGGNVHPMAAAGMVYPPFLTQIAPHYGTTPVMMPTYPYDVDSMNRFQPGFYGQHPTSQDQGGGASLVSGLGRDPQTGGGGATTSFGTDNKYDSSSTNPLQPQQQGALQQPHNQMNAFYGHYPNMLYPMYPHMGMAAAAATGYSTQPMGHKPGTATTYPVGTSYQPTPQFPHYDEADFSKLYGGPLGKTSQVPSTSSADYNAYSKHQFDTKSAAGYGNYPHMAGGPLSGYMLGHHPALPLMTHDTSSRSKPHKYNPATGWSGASSHTHT